MQKHIFETKEQMGAAAAECAASKIQKAIAQRDEATIILATGASQVEMLKHLVKADVDWSKVNVFHPDEYMGIGADHPASERRFLKDHFINKVGRLKSIHYVVGDASDPASECRRLSEIIAQHPIDVAMMGIGENGHLAFNDPPADFQTEEPFIIVALNTPCRRQQVAEGWLATLENVPRQAISMSINQALKSKSVIITVADHRKSIAVRQTLLQSVSPMRPASILQKHPDCILFMDRSAAALLSPF